MTDQGWRAAMTSARQDSARSARSAGVETSGAAPLADRTKLPWLLLALSIAVVARLLFHALFLPAYEGPDEPYHLARISAFADEPLLDALRGIMTSGEIVAAWQARPCSPGVARMMGCPPYQRSVPALFNLVHPTRISRTAPPIPNPENNQPPLFYALAGLGLRAADALGLPITSPDARLLAARLLCVLLIGVGLLMLREIARSSPPWVVLAALIALLVPGAAESLARCANDAPVFLWSALVLVALARRRSTGTVALLLALGPLIKLTAIPIVVFAVASLWLLGRLATALAGTAASLAVFPLQLARGWRWGGTYELNTPGTGIHDQPIEVLLGLARSVYTFLKTTIWLGGWSFFRLPRPLLVLAVLALVVWFSCLRRRARPPMVKAYVASLAVAGAGLLTFALANRSYFGVWGGVGGWYAWGWAPLLAAATSNLFALDPKRQAPLLWMLAAVAIILNIAYHVIAMRVYTGS